MSVIGVSWVFSSSVTSIRTETRGAAQSQAYYALEAKLGTDGQLITLWPPALPYRRHATYYPFGHEPLLQLFGADIERQYLEVIDRDVTTLVVGYDQKLSAPRIPRFDAAIRAKFRQLTDLPRPEIISDAYERIPERELQQHGANPNAGK